MIYPDYWQKHHRRSIRLKKFGYDARNSYFVTINVSGKENVLGDIDANGRLYLNAYGQIAHDSWKSLPRHFPFITLDAFVIMPNHVHGILHLYHDATIHSGIVRRGVACYAPTDADQDMDRKLLRGPASGSLGAVIRSYKSAVTKRINIIRNAPGVKLWQRNYYERVIRSAMDLQRIRQYIESNPVRWKEKDRLI